MYKKTIYALSLLSFIHKIHTAPLIQGKDVQNLADTAVENYFAKRPDFFSALLGYSSIGQYAPERLDVAATKNILKDYALTHCYLGPNRYDKTCSEIKIAERLATRIINRVDEIIRNKVDGIPLDSSARTNLITKLHNNIQNELSSSINIYTGRVDMFGYEALISGYTYLQNKDFLDQKIEHMLQLELPRQVKEARSEKVPNYNYLAPEYAPSAPVLPSYEEVTIQQIVLPLCGHTIDRDFLIAAFISAKSAGKLVSCPLCSKQYYNDSITTLLKN